jgi:putative nucleotidyltransferase with HDIG domain
MISSAQQPDLKEWRRLFRSTLWRWRHYALIRGLDEATFERYSEESRSVQDAIGALAALPSPTKEFLAALSPSLQRVIARMYRLGDDITAFVLFRSLGNLQEDRGLDEEAARSLQFAGRCGRVMGFYEESLLLLERARRCAMRAQPDHPLLIEIHDLMGLVCHFTSRLDEAEVHYLKSIDLLGRWPARTVYRHLWRSKTRLLGLRLVNLVDLHLVRARSLSGEARAKEIARARELLERASDCGRNDGHVRALADGNEGEVLMVEGRLGEAKSMLQSRLAAYNSENPDSGHALPPVHRLLAQIAAEEGQVREAYANCREALQLSLRYANSVEEGLAVETTLDIMARFMKPRISGANLQALTREDRQIIQNLVLLLEGKDWYTGNNHSRAVSWLCRRIGDRLIAQPPGMPLRAGSPGDRVDLEMLEMAGLLHDIGKLRIPWSLLNKRNPLLPLEHRVLESHVTEGSRMLRHLGFTTLAKLAEEHHEKVDGSGYPAGKRQLTLMGATVAVADAFEAMITPNRRYAHPRSKTSALMEISALSGIHYDPRVVEALKAQVGA